jgi:hypothetical protein
MSTEILTSSAVVEAGPSSLLPQFANDLPFLSQAETVGRAFNVYGELSSRSLKRPLLDRRKAGETTFTFLGKEYAVPSYVSAVEDTRADYFGGTCESREKFQNGIAAHAQVQGSAGFFSGEMRASYDWAFESSSLYSFAYQNFVSHLAHLDFDPGPGLQALSDDFVKRVQDLPAEARTDSLPLFVRFFEDFGGYYTRRVTLGCSLRFAVSVHSDSKLGKEDITAMMKAQYDGLFTSGSIAADVKQSLAWKAYSATSQTDIQAMGGDPEAITALIAVPPLDPSGKTVEAFQSWVRSVKSDPAICDFALEGIWTLCGDKAEAVRQAWKMYIELLHARLTIRTVSSGVPLQPWPPQTTPAPPAINLRHPLKPLTPPETFCGFQMVFLEPSQDLAELFKVRHNRYYSVELHEPWKPVYGNVYKQIQVDLETVAKKGDLVILSSFGIDYNMVPPHDLMSLLQSVGADLQLQDWLESAAAGHESGGWIGAPANYALVGIKDAGTGTGVEAMTYTYSRTLPVLLALDVYLYRDSLDGSFTLGLGA